MDGPHPQVYGKFKFESMCYYIITKTRGHKFDALGYKGERVELKGRIEMNIHCMKFSKN